MSSVGLFMLIFVIFSGLFCCLVLAAVFFVQQKKPENKHIEKILRGIRYSDEAQATEVDRLGKLSDKLIGLKESGNIAYIFSGVLAVVLFTAIHATVYDSLSEDLQMFSIFVPCALFVAIPFFYKKVMRERRQEEITLILPFIIDLYVICLEAGLSFAASTNRIVFDLGTKSQFIARNFQLMVLEMDAGVTNRDALINLVARCRDHSEMKTFVSVINQSDARGFSIVETLKTLSLEFREKRKQRIREKMGKVPVKILFPLAFCILPVICIILVGPGAMQVLQNLK